MFRLFASWTLVIASVSAAEAERGWKEFVLGAPSAPGPVNPLGVVRNGALRARSISARTLIAIAAGVPESRIVGPDWIGVDRFSISAVFAEGSPGQLRRRVSGGSPPEVVFREAFAREIASRFELEVRRETREVRGFTVRAATQPGMRSGKARPVRFREGGGFERKGTPLINVMTNVKARGVTMAELCEWLERRLQSPVLSSGGLPAGVWDFNLRWRTGDEPALLRTVREQTGLELTAGDVAAEFVVVTRIRRLAP